MTAYYPKPEILRTGIDVGRHHLIEASAGTGKTFTLEHLVVDLLLSGIKLNAVLVVTFTEKATQELRARIRKKIEELLRLPEGAGSDREPDACWRIDEDARLRLREALFDFENASIHTIHGFCNLVLHEFAFENLQWLKWEQVNQKMVVDNLFQAFLRREVLAQPGQVRDLLLDYLGETPNGLALDRESGFGKSLERTLKELLAKRGMLYPDPDEARKAWEDWQAFVARHQVQDILNNLNINGTTLKYLLASAARLCEVARLPGQSWWLGLARCHELKDKDYWDPTAWRFNKKQVEGKINDLKDMPETLCGFFEKVRRLMAHAVDLKGMLLLHLLPSLRRAVAEEKTVRGWIDFDDMIRLVAQGLAHPEQGSALRQALRAKYRCALIDEFQDTDPDQWSIFSTLFLESEDHRLFLIGDPKQAIYRFRGADVHTYLEAGRRVEAVGGRKVSLEHNFRASPAMVAAINDIFGSASLFQGAIGYGMPLRCGRPETGMIGDDSAAVVCLGLSPEAEGSDLTAPQLKEGYARWIAEEIGVLIRKPGLSILDAEGRERPLLPRDIAVLTRTKTESKDLGAALGELGIAHAFYKQGGLFRTREAENFYDLLEAIEYNGDEASLFKALLTDFFPVALSELLERPVVPETYRQWFAEWRRMAYRDRDLHKLFDNIFTRTRVFERLLFAEDDERAVTNYEHIADILKREAVKGDFLHLLTVLRAYMDGNFGMDEDLLRLETEKNAVQIMTIHASKGLEFPVVFLYGGFSGERQSDPFHDYQDPDHGRVLDFGKNHPEEHQAEALAECERLYYVALTRARFKLYLPYLAPESTKKIGGGIHVLRQSLADLEQARPPHFRFELRPFRHAAPRSGMGVCHSETGSGQPRLPAEPPDFQGILAKRSRFQLTSYTRMTSKSGAVSGLSLDSWWRRRSSDESSEPVPESPDLPGGRETGVCLHEILERTAELKLDRYGRTDFAEWRKDPDVAEILKAHLQSYELAGFYEEAALHVWHALRTPLGDCPAIGELEARDRLHEVVFYYPLQNTEERETMVNGAIDLVFRHEGRYYFADWKTDTLPAYGAAALAGKVEADYRLQVQIYLRAVARWLGLDSSQAYDKRFGGLYYLFIRGMRHGQGVYFHRPPWPEVATYESRILASA